MPLKDRVGPREYFRDGTVVAKVLLNGFSMSGKSGVIKVTGRDLLDLLTKSVEALTVFENGLEDEELAVRGGALFCGCDCCRDLPYDVVHAVEENLRDRRLG